MELSARSNDLPSVSLGGSCHDSRFIKPATAADLEICAARPRGVAFRTPGPSACRRTLKWMNATTTQARQLREALASRRDGVFLSCGPISSTAWRRAALYEGTLSSAGVYRTDGRNRQSAELAGRVYYSTPASRLAPRMQAMREYMRSLKATRTRTVRRRRTIAIFFGESLLEGGRARGGERSRVEERLADQASAVYVRLHPRRIDLAWTRASRVVVCAGVSHSGASGAITLFGWPSTSTLFSAPVPR